MKVLEYLLAMLLGVTALPLRVIYKNAQLAFFAFVIGVIALVGVPTIISVILNRRGFSFTQNLFISVLLVTPITALLIAIGLPLTGIYLVYSTILGLVKIIWSGLKTGFTDGMEGFWCLWSSQNSNLDWIYNLFRERTNGLAEELQIRGVDDFNLMNLDLTQLVDVEKKPICHEVPDMQALISSAAVRLLDEEETKIAEELIKEFSALKIPLPLNIKNQVEQLQLKIENYKELSSRLKLIHQALIDGRVSAINNEVIQGLEVVTPIMFYKRYLKDNHWYTVSGTSFVTDKDSLLQWLKQNPTHPINRDIIKNPPKYHDMTTEYRWHILSLEYCSTPELTESAIEIYQLLKTLPQQLQKLQQTRIAACGIQQTIFNSSHPAKTEQRTIASMEYSSDKITGLIL